MDLGLKSLIPLAIFMIIKIDMTNLIFFSMIWGFGVLGIEKKEEKD